MLGGVFIQPGSLLTFRLLLANLCLVAAVVSPGAVSSTEQPQPDVAFYYGDEAPIGSLMAYDWAVLQKDRVSDARLDLLRQAGTVPITYVSVGEMARSHRFFPELDASWRIGSNPDWDSEVLDLRQPRVRAYILDRLVDPAMERGFQGVFLDTLDSFQLVAEDETDRAAFAQAQKELIAQIRERHPEARIILNRGFHLPSPTKDMVDALAFESWLTGYDPSNDSYRQVSEADRDWLEVQLAPWREARPDMPIIAIDYAEQGSEGRELAQRLREEGFVPWVGNGDLTRLSPTKPEQVQRHTLVMHDLASHNMDQSAAHRFAGIVLENLGLVPHYRSTQRALPQEPASDRYAGIVVWLERGGRHAPLCSWLARQQNQGVPVVMLGEVPTDPACRGVLGAQNAGLPEGPITHTRHQQSVGRYEGRRLPAVTRRNLPQSPDSQPWLTLEDNRGQTFSPVYTHEGGGVAAAPFVFETGPDEDQFWLFDPFAFFAEALKAPPLPAIDTTTESGRRILTSHIDGDAFISRAEFPGNPLSAQVLKEQILERYPLPRTVSVIEAELSPQGLYPMISSEAEQLARRIFRMDNVEVASHTYSHPFFWQLLEGGRGPSLDSTLYGYFMNIPDYEGSLEREIEGSVAYINKRLAPSEKPVSVFLWSGDARPGEQALRRVREAGLHNVNGGNTRPKPHGAELTATWPDARPVGDELQVYAPVMNENVYTNEWTGPYYGFRNVIDTFRILEDKGRLKPIGIYYHFYSATKPEALSALREIYDYALSQPVTPLYLSEYAERVQTRYYSALLRDEDGAWHWRGTGQPRSVKVSRDQYPDMASSRGVAGYHDVAGNRYIHLLGDSPRLALRQTPPQGPYIEQANGVLTAWERERQGDRWRLAVGLRSHQPAMLMLSGAQQCRALNGEADITRRGDRIEVRRASQRIDNLTLECR